MSNPLADKARHMFSLKMKIDELKGQAARLQNEYDFLRNSALPDLMESEDVPKFTIGSIGRTCHLMAEVYTGMKDHALGQQWLIDNGYGALVKPYVQPGSLRALIREQIKEGVEFPEEIFKVELFSQARLRKS